VLRHAARVQFRTPQNKPKKKNSEYAALHHG